MKLERLSWGLFLQIMIFIALIAGLIHSEWALGLLIWLSRKIKNMLTRLEISYYEHIDDFIVQLQKANKKIKIAIKILCLIFIGLILASIILLIAHQPIYAALCVLILALGPFLLAHALSVAALDLIAMPIAGLAAWLLLIAFNFLVWPLGTINLGWRLSILILLMLISSVFVISGRKTRGAPLVLAIALSVGMMIYSSSSWVQAIGNKLGGKFAISTASSNRWAGADQRRAEAIREFTKGIVIEEGLFRDEKQPQTITKKAIKGIQVMIEYKDNRPIRSEPASALSQQFKGSFCKVYLPDEHGSFPKTGQAWWIEDIKIQDTKILMPKIIVPVDFLKDNKSSFRREFEARLSDGNYVKFDPRPALELNEGILVGISGPREYKWGFDIKENATMPIGITALAPRGAETIYIRGPRVPRGDSRKFKIIIGGD